MRGIQVGEISMKTSASLKSRMAIFRGADAVFEEKSRNVRKPGNKMKCFTIRVILDAKMII